MNMKSFIKIILILFVCCATLCGYTHNHQLSIETNTSKMLVSKTSEKSFIVSTGINKNKQLMLFIPELPMQTTFPYKAFVAAAFIALTIGGIIIIRSRNQWKQKANEYEIRNKVAIELYEDLNVAMHSINMLSQMDADAVITDSKEIISRVKEYSDESIEKINDLVWVINPVKGEEKSAALKQRMEQLLLDICQNKKIRPLVDIDCLLQTHLNPEQRKGIYLVFKEAINNAAKYAEFRNLKCSMQENLGTLTMTISDDGKGFELKEANKGNGLQNMQSRAKALGGSVMIDSEPQKGTEITFSIPV